MELTNISVIKGLMQRHGVSFSKSLGQNFLVNPSVSPRIAQLGGASPEVGVLEIGPGIGVLTKELAMLAKKVVAIELDRTLIPILGETLGEFSNVKIIEGDVLRLNLKEIIAAEFPNMEVVVCANLPYYITSPIIMRLLEDSLPIKSITAMVQKETAERICAPIPSREVGTITLSIAYYAHVEILFGVSPGSFIPKPKVDSSVIKLTLSGAAGTRVERPADYFRVVKASFSQRRKTILNSLSAGLAVDKKEGLEILDAAGVSPGLRAEQLTQAQFESVANAYSRRSPL